jgi:hypothetical protein
VKALAIGVSVLVLGGARRSTSSTAAIATR